MRRAAAAGWPVAVHAIGDAANRAALDAFEATRDEWEPRGLRHRIEHAQCLAAEDVGRFAALGVAASVQFSHAPSDRDLADRLWPDRLDGAYAYRSLHASGARLALGSDAPVEEMDPLLGLRDAVLREWRSHETLDLQAALEALTVTPAWLAGDDRHLGAFARMSVMPRSDESSTYSGAADSRAPAFRTCGHSSSRTRPLRSATPFTRAHDARNRCVSSASLISWSISRARSCARSG